MKTNIFTNFQICISVPLSIFTSIVLGVLGPFDLQKLKVFNILKVKIKGLQVGRR